MNECCDLRTMLETQMYNLSLSQTQIMQSTLQAPTYISANQHFIPHAPAWTQIAYPYYFPQVPKNCCESIDIQHSKRTNCKNCGAPLMRDGFCKYCDTYN